MVAYSADLSHSNTIVSKLAEIVFTITSNFRGLFYLAAVFSFYRSYWMRKNSKKARTINKLRALSWRQIESYVCNIYRQNSFEVVETRQNTDDSVDLIVRKDSKTTYVQCQHWRAGKIDVSEVTALLDTMTIEKAEEAVLLTTGQCTAEATQLAQNNQIRLIDGEGLEYSMRRSSIK